MTKKSSSALAGADSPEIDPFDAAIEAHEKDLAEIKAARIPPESGGIQINFCKNPACENFGKPEEGDIAKWSKKGQARYKVSSAGKAYPHLTCRACGSSFPIKSNLGIHEELQRMAASAEAHSSEPCCPNEDCDHHGLGVSVGKPFYSSFGSTKAGSPRWKCMACSKTFSTPKASTLRQRESHKNKRIFEMLVNKVPLRRICELAKIGPKALYGKIDFFHRQCEKFLAAREAKLPDLSIRRLYLGVDRQDYAVNWTRREDRRNTVLSAVATVDNETGYCFGLELNFDPSLDPEEIEKSAYAARDYAVFPPFRKHARVWLEQDYAAAMKKSPTPAAAASLRERVAKAYAAAEARQDPEASDDPTKDEKLPSQGMQIHSEYTLYAHFLRIKQATAGAEKVRFFLDQDSGMRAACLAAFADDIKAKRRVDAFFVKIAKEMTVDQKRRLKRKAEEALSLFMEEHPGASKSDAILAMLKERLAAMSPIGAWNDRWVDHPFPDMSEPAKAVSHLTDLGDYDLDHLAWLYNKASLHAVDTMFMQIRRRITMLERGIHSQGNAGRVWTGYAVYNPKQIAKMLVIFRAVRNFVLDGDDDMTPAMRLGLARGPVRYEDILYFK
ncbi:MAG: hypothetical protein KGL61_09455 [Burkholderiales bacterium]|nr:hypothetical protein [Burkholderiales bacterium]